MGFWSALGSAFGSGAASGAGNAIGAGLSHKIHGNDVTRAGYKMDIKYSPQLLNAMYQQAKRHGLTPQEFYGAPASGGNNFTSGPQTMGNMASSAGIQTAQAVQADLDRKTDLEKTKISADAQVKSAEISAGATTYSADKTYDGVMKKLEFDKTVYRDVTLPQAGRIAKKTNKEIEHLVNQVALTQEKFVKTLKVMSMGTDNTLGLAIQNMLGIDVTDVEQMQNLSPEQRKNLIEGMMTAGSRAARELAGAQTSVNRYLDSFVKALEQGAKGITDMFKGPGIEPAPSLGNPGPNPPAGGRAYQ